MNPCTRCGKETIVKSTYKEKVGTSTVTYTLRVCPDPECQKIVEKNLKIEEEKRRIIREEQERRALLQSKKKFRRKDISIIK
jgi:hypothetical protein